MNWRGVLVVAEGYTFAELTQFFVGDPHAGTALPMGGCHGVGSGIVILGTCIAC